MSLSVSSAVDKEDAGDDREEEEACSKRQQGLRVGPEESLVGAEVRPTTAYASLSSPELAILPPPFLMSPTGFCNRQHTTRYTSVLHTNIAQPNF